MTLDDLYRLLRSGHVQAQGVVDTITQAVVVLDQHYCVTTANNAFLHTFKVDRDDILDQSLFELGNGQWDIPELRLLLSEVIPKTAAIVGYEVKHEFPRIGQRTFLVDARRLVQPGDNSSNLLLIFDDVTDSQRHEAEMDFIVAEMRHRMRNLFAVVRGIAMQSSVEGRTARDYRDAFLGRLEIALQAQDMAASRQPADFDGLLTRSVNGSATDRIIRDGPAVEIGSAQVLAVGLIFHELATNALKHGALSTADGVVNVAWSTEVDRNGRKFIRCTWQEEGGPPVASPERRGYGTELIRGTSAHAGGSVELNYAPRGFAAVIRLPL